MARAPALLGLAAPALFLLASCGEEAAEPDPDLPVETEQPATGSPAEVAPAQLSKQVEGATPMEERIATLGLINKRNNVTQDLELRPGESQEIGPVIVRLSACERTAPWEMPQEVGAFVQVEVQNRGSEEFTRIFSGWLFNNSPSLNVVEHPIYDVWVKDCAMNFPGDE
ncbi:DUF2155 domain-containing protein [Altererythrobacter sp. GH1-8]|uniref:DUF2155 domain-containing protein n=1 Tax=Altererythrobacter sp. GH1-8 TaxID=3349333 RepID=UPI00374DBEAC